MRIQRQKELNKYISAYTLNTTTHTYAILHHRILHSQ